MLDGNIELVFCQLGFRFAQNCVRGRRAGVHHASYKCLRLHSQTRSAAQGAEKWVPLRKDFSFSSWLDIKPSQ